MDTAALNHSPTPHSPFTKGGDRMLQRWLLWEDEIFLLEMGLVRESQRWEVGFIMGERETFKVQPQVH